MAALAMLAIYALLLCSLARSLQMPRQALSIMRHTRRPAASRDSDPLVLSDLAQRVNAMSVKAMQCVLQTVYKDRPFARFAALETIARVPYFSYTSVLHLYETLGWFRKKEHIQLHFSQSWNELHHLLIMEALGGAEAASDRLIAQGIAFVYYWLVVFLFMVHPAMAYNLNKHVELHAAESYSNFLSSHGEELKRKPAPQIALDYYQSSKSGHPDTLRYPRDKADGASSPPRPSIHNLYDVLDNIRLDEIEHARSMEALQNERLAVQ